VPLVDVDHEAVGQMAAQYFLDRGYRHFGFFGSEWAHYSKLREAAFRLRLAEAGHTVSACYIEYLLRVPAILEWKRAAHRVREWLEKLSKPVGILTANDIPARELAGACLRFGLRVPDDVALLGVDNDDLECGFSWPPLSSVATPARRIGYEAAKLLDELMAGKSPPREPILLPPIAVVTRQSTDTLAIDDPAVVAALRFIRAQATGTIRVDDVVQHAVQGRRMLEYKFRDFVGHTILEEIRRVRIERVKELLRDTDLSMPAIARRSGFITPERMSVVFRELTGLTPSGYRQQAAIRDL
jgi:LacI family transcriptional regulator